LDDGDTGFHIRQAEFILENHTIPKVDIFSFHAPPIRWIAHEWLSEVLMGLVHKYFGITGVGILFSFVIATIYYLLYRFVKGKKGNILISATLVILSALTSYFIGCSAAHFFNAFFAYVYYILRSINIEQTAYLFSSYSYDFVVNLHGGFILGS